MIRSLNDYFQSLDENSKNRFTDAVKRIKHKKGIHGTNLGIPLLREYAKDNDWGSVYLSILKYAAMEYPPVMDKTDVPIFDDVLAGRYIRKGWFHKVLMMSPDTYLMRCKNQTKYEFQPEPDLVTEYAHKALDGSNMPMPFLEYVVDEYGKIINFSQEGRHRSYSLKLLGVDLLKVLVVVRPNTLNTSKEKLYRKTMLKILRIK